MKGPPASLLLLLVILIFAQLGRASDKSCTCEPTTLLKDCCCSIGDVDQVHEELTPKLQTLLETNFFRYYKINLNLKCPFWQDDPMCVLKECCVTECNEEELPAKWRQQFSDITLPETAFKPFIQKCQLSEKDFCMVENDNSEGVYVDLHQNPEAFTGYAGPSAARIWQSIYSENCFQKSEGDQLPCTEKRIFFRLISGMHTSISSHLSARYYDKSMDHWDFNWTSFENRIMNFPDRVENLYFVYAVMLRAITKLSSYLLAYDFSTGNPEMDAKTEAMIRDVATHISNCPKPFDETSLFIDAGSEDVKREIKASFRNISRIMDCVSCERCKLWGKVQTFGIGTALKVLFSFENPLENYDYSLQRSEIVALFNAFGQFSESLEFVKEYKQRKALEAAQKQESEEFSTFDPRPSPLLPFELHPSVISLFEWLGFQNPELAFSLSVVTGLILFFLVLGLSPKRERPGKGQNGEAKKKK